MGIRNLFFKNTKQKEVNESEKTMGEILLSQWEQIYTGNAPWLTVRKGGLNGGFRRMNQFNGAKIVAHELANLCFSEQAQFICEDERTKAFLDKHLVQVLLRFLPITMGFGLILLMQKTLFL